jgi:hypothetical protein
VAKRVVHQPEAIEVDVQHGDGVALPVGAGQRQVEVLHEHRAVG